MPSQKLSRPKKSTQKLGQAGPKRIKAAPFGQDAAFINNSFRGSKK